MKNKKLIIALLSMTMCFGASVFAACNKGQTTSSSSSSSSEQTEYSVTMSDEQVTMKRFEQIVLTAALDGFSGEVEWSSSDESIATVESGVVTALGEGKVTITAKCGEEIGVCEVNVVASNIYPALELGRTDATLKVGDVLTVAPKIVFDKTEYALSAETTATSSAPDKVKAELTADGKIKVAIVGASETPVSITVSTVWRDVTLTKTLTVNVVYDVAISLSSTALTLSTFDDAGALNAYGIYRQQNLRADVYYNGELVQSPVVTWTTDDASVASVENGVVTAQSNGNANITAEWISPDGAKLHALCTVTVQIGQIALDGGYVYLNEEDGKAEVDVSEYLPNISGVTATDVTSESFSVGATVANGIVALDRTELVAGERTLALNYADQVVFNVKACVVSKVLKTAEDLANIKTYGIVTESKEEEKISEKPLYKLDGYFLLGNNIDLREYTEVIATDFEGNTAAENKVCDWGFVGTFNGQGYTVYGGNFGEGGIFGSLGVTAMVKNVAFIDATLQASGNLLAKISYGSLQNVLMDYKLAASNTIAELFSWVIGGRFENVVVYSPTEAKMDGQYSLSRYIPYNIAAYGGKDPTKFVNCTVFTDNKASNTGVCTNYLQAESVTEIATFAVGTTCKKAGLNSLDQTLWVTTGNQAYFASMSDFFIQYVDGIAETFPESMYAGDVISLPTKANVTYLVKNDCVTVEDGKLSIANDIEESFTMELYVCYDGVPVEAVEISVLKVKNVFVENVEKYVIYTGLDGAAPVANSKQFVLELPQEAALADMEWTANGKNITHATSLNGNTLTIHAIDAGVVGTLKLVGVAGEGDDITVVRIDALFVSAVLKTAAELAAWETFAIKETGSCAEQEAVRYDGYFELGANIDLGTTVMNRRHALGSSDIPNNKQYEWGFVGTFDGCGYTVINGVYGDGVSYAGGLFGLVGKGAVIKNIAFKDTLVNSYAAVLAQSLYYATVENVLVESNLNKTYIGFGLSYHVAGGTFTNTVVIMTNANGTLGSDNLAYGYIYAPNSAWGNGATELATFTNCYVITNYSTDSGKYGKGTGYTYLTDATALAAINSVAYTGTTCASVGFTGFNEYWNFHFDKPYFKSYTKTFVNDHEDEMATIPTSVYQGDVVTLPEISSVKYSVDNTDVATVDGNVLTVTTDLEQDATLTLTLDLSAYGADNRTFEIAVKKIDYVRVEGEYKHVLYTGLTENGERVANEENVTVELGLDSLPENLVWSIGSTEVTEYVTADKNGLTFDAQAANLYGGEYRLVGRNADKSYAIDIRLKLVTAVIDTADELLNWEKFGDKTDKETFNMQVLRYDPKDGEKYVTETFERYVLHGSFELGANIDLTGKEVKNGMLFQAKRDTKYGLDGTFDGCGYTIYGGTYYEGGLFGGISENGTLKNIAFTAATTKTSSPYYYQQIGTVVAQTVSGTLSNVLVDCVGRDVSHKNIKGNALEATVAQETIGAHFENCVFSIPLLAEGVCVIAEKDVGLQSTFDNVYCIGTDHDAYRRVFFNRTDGIDGVTLRKDADTMNYMDLDDTIWTFVDDQAYFKSYMEMVLTESVKALKALDKTVVKETAEKMVLPSAGAAVYTVNEDSGATIDGNLLILPKGITADVTLTVTLDTSLYGGETVTITITVQNRNNAADEDGTGTVTDGAWK